MKLPLERVEAEVPSEVDPLPHRPGRLFLHITAVEPGQLRFGRHQHQVVPPTDHVVLGLLPDERGGAGLDSLLPRSRHGRHARPTGSASVLKQ